MEISSYKNTKATEGDDGRETKEKTNDILQPMEDHNLLHPDNQKMFLRT